MEGGGERSGEMEVEDEKIWKAGSEQRGRGR